MLAKSTVATFPAMGVDTVENLAGYAAGLKAAGMSFCCRYLGSLTATEAAAIWAASLAIMPVTFGGWQPTPGWGIAAGGMHVRQAMGAGIPAGTTIWLDLEADKADAASTIVGINDWAGEVKAGGYDAGLYVGAGQPLNGQQLYALAVDRYWKSFSTVPQPTCGWSMIQLYHTVTIAGANVDVDVLQYDYNGRLPNWAISY